MKKRPSSLQPRRRWVKPGAWLRLLSLLPVPLEREHLRWAQREIDPMHPEMHYIALRLRDLESDDVTARDDRIAAPEQAYYWLICVLVAVALIGALILVTGALIAPRTGVL